MMRIALVAVLAISACQILDDARYKPRVGPLVPDAAPPPDVGLNGACPIVPGDPCPDSNPNVEVSFANDIKPILTSTVAPGGCMSHMLMQIQVKLDVSTYESLRMGGAYAGPDIIIDCQPCKSILVRKLGPKPPFGARMPMDNVILPDDKITLIRDWIAEGARNN